MSAKRSRSPQKQQEVALSAEDVAAAFDAMGDDTEPVMEAEPEPEPEPTPEPETAAPPQPQLDPIAAEHAAAPPDALAGMEALARILAKIVREETLKSQSGRFRATGNPDLTQHFTPENTDLEALAREQAERLGHQLGPFQRVDFKPDEAERMRLWPLGRLRARCRIDGSYCMIGWMRDAKTGVVTPVIRGDAATKPTAETLRQDNLDFRKMVNAIED